MRLILVRHAHAEPAGPGQPDELRPLSARGRDEARALGEELASRTPSVVLTSPLLRARETAGAIEKATGAELRIDERLAPGATPEDVLEALEDLEGTVVTVGHQPDCSLIVEALAGRDADFPPAAHVELELG